jgi:EF-P beta-lysylation protein EpmB
MAPDLPQPWPAGLWRDELADAVTDVDELLGLLDLDHSCLGDRAEAASSERQFRLRVPRGFVARMNRGEPDDPLLRQVLPLEAESMVAQGFSADPVGELRAPQETGLLRKYRGRALLVVTGACGVHCRYCFRRHFPYGEHTGVERWAKAVARIAADPSLEELILSGGDPLTVPDELLSELAAMIAQAPHVSRLRIHTRIPIVLPQRVDETLVSWLRGLRPQTVVVVHANHEREIDDDVARAMAVLASAGVALLNQAVLLRGVNDSVEAQRGLSERLIEVGVMPYYLHLLDRVEGAAHFDVPEAEARLLMAELRASLPGYLVPRLVQEVEGEPSKVPVELRP